MRYLCTLYTNVAPTSPHFAGFVPTEPSFDSPMARVVVSGSSLRHAAARAYIRCVAQGRVERLQLSGQVSAAVLAHETSCKAIAPSLRKVHRRIGECYEMDNYPDVWSIKVVPFAVNNPRRLRLRTSLLHHFFRTPSPN
jgi:hypothetical protein